MSEPVLLAIIISVPSTIDAIGSLITAVMVARQKGTIHNLEKNTNSMKDTLVAVTARSEFARGKLEGAEPPRDDTM